MDGCGFVWMNIEAGRSPRESRAEALRGGRAGQSRAEQGQQQQPEAEILRRNFGLRLRSQEVPMVRGSGDSEAALPLLSSDLLLLWPPTPSASVLALGSLFRPALLLLVSLRFSRLTGAASLILLRLSARISYC